MKEKTTAGKWRKTVLSVFIVLLCALAAGVWNSRTEKLVESQPAEVKATGQYALEEEAQVTQFFQAKYSCLQSVSIMPTNLDEGETGSLLVSLLEEDGKELCSGSVPLPYLKAGDFYEIPLEVVLKRGETYQLRFSSRDIREYVPVLISIYTENAVPEQGILVAGGESRQDGLALTYKYKVNSNTAYQDGETRHTAIFKMIMACLLLLTVLAVILLYIWLPPFHSEGKKALQPDAHLLRQWAFVLLWPALFLTAALLGGGSPEAEGKDKLICMLLAAAGLLAVWLFAGKARKAGGSRPPQKTLAQRLKEERYFFAALAAAALPRLFMFTDLQRWDGGDYYSKLAWACERFLFTWSSYWERFRLNGHWALGSSLFLSLGEFLDPYGVKGALAVQLVLSLAAVACLYSLLPKWVGGLGRGKAAAAAFLISCTPLFLGTFNYINMDYLLAVFFLFMLYAEAKQEYVLMAFWAMMLTQSKETGLFVAAGYLSFRLAAGFLLRKGKLGTRLTGVLCDRGNWAAVFTGMSVLLNLYLLGSFGEWAGDMTGIQEAVGRTNYFGFDPGFILHKLKQIFVLNFAWLCVALLFVCLVFWLFFRRKRRNCGAQTTAGAAAGQQENAAAGLRLQYAGLIGGLSAFLIFSCLYITSNLYRYDVIAVMALSTLTAVVYLRTFGRKQKKGAFAVGSVFLLLFLAQSYADVDPVSNLVFRTLPTGGIPKNMSNYQSDYYGDGLVNNYQYIWLDDLFDKMLKDCGFDADTAVILAGRQYSGTQVNGNGEKYAFAWDPQKQSRVMANTQKLIDGELPELLEIRTQKTAELIGCFPWKTNTADTAVLLEQLPQKAIVFFLPYFQEDEELQMKNLEPYYYAGERRIQKTLYGQIAYYQVWKKESYKGFSLDDFLEQKEPEAMEPADTLENYQYRYAKVGAFLEEREDIRYGDSVRFYLEARIAGEKAPLYLLEPGNILATVGDGTLLEGLEESLIGHKAGDVYEYCFRVPEGYPAAARFAGEEAVFSVTVLQNEGRRYVEDMEPEAAQEMQAAYERMQTFYQEEKAVREAVTQVRENRPAEGGLTEAVSREERKQLEDYLSAYLADCEIKEEEFRKNQLNCSAQELNTAKEQLVQAVLFKEAAGR